MLEMNKKNNKTCKCQRITARSLSMEIGRCFRIFCFASIFCTIASTATHFRGGTAWWSPIANYTDNPTQFRLEYYVGWRNSFQDFECDHDISNRSLIEDNGKWESDVGDLGKADFVCNEHDPNLDWMVGYNEIVVNTTNLTDTSILHVWYQGRCWIDKLYYPGCAWNLSLFTNLGVRSDIGKPNSTPKSGSIPIKRLQAGCPTTIEIPTTDPDGDRVRCRFAETTDECGDVCQHFPFFTFVENTCLLSYNGGGSDALVTVAVVIEDYSRADFIMNEGLETERQFTTQDSISSIPLQFLVSFYTSDDPCNVRPYFVRPTPPDGQTITAIVADPISMQIYASPSGSSENITDFVFVFPHGARKSSIVQHSDDVYMVNVSWTPTTSHIGTNIFCFSATDSSRISEQRCITIVVGDERSACEINNGGCSDACQTLGRNYICDCPRDCWSLSDDERTCKPDVSIKCFPSSMQVSVSTCAVDIEELTIGKDELVGPIPEECQKRTENGSYIFNFNFDQCGTLYQEDFWNITYYNYVRLFADLSGREPDSVITRGKWYSQALTCTFSKFGNLTTSFQPQNINVELVAVPGLGSFSFFIDFYNNITFEEATSPYDYPVPATINSDIYFAVRAVGGSAGMQLFTMNCEALPTKTKTPDTPVYTMIRDGCLEDQTMREYITASPMEKRYSIKAFQFRDSLLTSNESTVVFIQCSVVVCTVGTTITTCSQGCIDAATRRKRSVMQPALSRYRRQTFIAGDDDDDDDDDDDEGDDSSSNVTESPVHDVRSDGGVQITINIGVAPGSDIDIILTDDANGNNNNEVNDESSYDLALLSIKIGIAVGSLALALLVGVVGVICYHNKVIRPRTEVTPLNNRHQTATTYVQDIYLPNDVVGFCDAQHHLRTKDTTAITSTSTDDEVLWARRVIRIPSNAPPYEANEEK